MSNRPIGARASAVAAALACSLSLGVAVAQPTPPGGTAETPAAEARRNYDEGSTHFRAGRFAEALTAFRRAYELRSNPVVLVPIIECHDRLNQPVEGLEAIERYLASNPTSAERTSMERRRETLRGRVGTLRIATTPVGARLSVDGHETGQVAPAAIPANPGHHVVSASLDGHQTTELPVDVTAGQSAAIALALAPTVTAPPTPTPTPPETNPTPHPPETTPTPTPTVPPGATAPTTPSSGGGPSAVVWVTAGVAGAGLIAGTVFGLMALSDRNEYQNGPTRELYDSGRTNALLSDIGFGAAVLAGGVAVVLYLSDRGSGEARPAPATAAAAAPSARWQLAPTGLRLSF